MKCRGREALSGVHGQGRVFTKIRKGISENFISRVKHFVSKTRGY